MNNDLSHKILEDVKIDPKGSLRVTCNNDNDEYESTLTETNRGELAARREHFEKSKAKSTRRSRRTLHRQYTQLIGSSYNGYHDANLMEHVSFKIRMSLSGDDIQV